MKRREFVTASARAGSALTLAAPFIARSQGAALPKIRIGQIGTAHGHASGKLRTMVKLKDHFEVVGWAEPDPDLREAARGQAPYRALPLLSVDDLLGVPGLNAVAVETAVKSLVPTAARCVAAGKHVHLDKPAGDSLPAFRRLLEEAGRKKLVVQMGYMLRYNPGIRLCFRAAREGWLGQVFELHAVMSKTIGQAVRDELAAFPGGAMFELGCHLIDSAVYILGQPDKVTAHLRHTRPDKDTLADNTLAVLEYPGATATIRSALIEFDGFRRRQFVVCGDNGTVDIRPLEPPKMQLGLAQARGGFKSGYQNVTLPASAGRYDGDFLDLAGIIRGEKEPGFTPAHDLAVQETVLRASGMTVS